MNQTRINLADYLATIEGDLFTRHADKEKVLDLFLKKYDLTLEEYEQLPGKFTIHPTTEGPKSAPYSFFLKTFYPTTDDPEQILEEKTIHLYKNIGLGIGLICIYLGINQNKACRILHKHSERIGERKCQAELKQVRETFLDTIWGEA